jgi:hypothetical protein
VPEWGRTTSEDKGRYADFSGEGHYGIKMLITSVMEGNTGFRQP